MAKFFNKENGVEYSKFEVKDMIVNQDDPEEMYHSTGIHNSAHWGQRKLGLALVQLLTIYWDKEKVPNPIVVYAGAAHGLNIAVVADLFPDVTFELYDLGNFMIEPTDKIHIYKQYFTNETAEQWSNRNDIFFVSDIRRDVKIKDGVDPEIEKMIWEDMNMQADWYRIIKPIKCQLKFRLPYVEESTKDIFGNYVKYLGGTLYRGIWAPHHSTECRLVPSGYDDVYWDIKKHELHMFYFNIKIRGIKKYVNPYYLSYYDNEETRKYAFYPIDPPELLNDYDSMAETELWILYLKKTGGNSNATLDNVKALEKYLTIKINMGSSNKINIQFKRVLSEVFKMNSENKMAKKKLKYLKDQTKILEQLQIINNTEVYLYNRFDFNNKKHWNNIARTIISNINSPDPFLKSLSDRVMMLS